MSALDLNIVQHGLAGQPVVIMHGLLGMARNWNTLAKELATDGYKVFCVDMRNHGESPHADSHTYADMAADVARVIQQKCDGEAAVIGHSMGGKAAMTLALQYPDKVSRLCVLDIAPKDYDHSYSDLIHAMQALDFAQVKSRGDVEKAMLATTHDIGFARFLAQNAGRDSQKGFKWNPNLPVLDAYMQDILQFPFVQGDAVYAGNTTVVRGGDSDYVLPEDIKIYQSYFPHVDMRGVAGAGHWLHAEKPQDTLQELRRFLASPQR